ncbi:hypothetical protein NMG60_11005045 [Bertholletia excelsa]
MSENPGWWRMSSQAYQSSSSASSFSSSSFPSQYAAVPFNSLPCNSLAELAQEFPQSWSHLLMGGLTGGEEDKLGLGHFQSKKLENWEDQQGLTTNPSFRVPVVDVKQEVAQSSQLYYHEDEIIQQTRRPSWSHQVMSVSSSPRSCITSLGASILDFSTSIGDGRNQRPDHSSECNSTATGGLFKKPRVQSSSTQQHLKVRKEKLGDRISALHQLVSPFGKTDTASVLLEAIGYIRFLQRQIEALSSPYLASASSKLRQQQSMLNDNGFLTRRASSKPGNPDGAKDLRSRGLCLVPVSCSDHVGNDGGADYWPPSGGGF